MQNEKYSEEYYKMKYYKYRAKYEQLKEFAQQQQLNEQNGGFKDIFKRAATSAKENMDAVIKKTNEYRADNKRVQDDTKINLMSEVADFLTSGLPDGKEKWKKLGRLENPCSYQQLIDMVNAVNIDKISNSEDKTKKLQKKNALINNIRRDCATTMGGLNALCKYTEPTGQTGGYSDSPDFLDDLSTEF